MDNEPHKFNDDEMRLNYGLSAIMDASHSYALKRIDRQTQLAIVEEVRRHLIEIGEIDAPHVQKIERMI